MEQQNLAVPVGMVPTVDPIAEQSRMGFYDRAREQNLAPLWRVLNGLVTEHPFSECVPTLWSYDRVRPYLMEAGKHITPEEAERRVMVLENPGMTGRSRITQSLFGGLQVILPGEIAPTHRHVASALRFIIEGHDAYTAVAGERTTMEVGDFVITPSMTWHDHGNESDAPMVWLDGLDMHIVNLFAASFREGYPSATHPLTRPEGAAHAAFGANMLPLDVGSRSQTSPIFCYPYRKSREALATLQRFSDPDPWHGFKMKYANPLSGDWAMPTIATWLQLLPKGFKSAPYRSTDSTVFVVVEGTGTTRVGGQVFHWRPKDIFVVPSWMNAVHEADAESVLFGYSDRGVQEKLDFWREEKAND